MRCITVIVIVLIGCAGADGQTPQFRVLDQPFPNFGVALAIGDVDGDGDNDVLTTSAIHVNDGNARFSQSIPAPITPAATLAAIANLNGDNLFDIVLLTSSATIAIYLNGPGLAFAAPIFGPGFTLPGAPASVTPIGFATGDVDNDGDIDLVFSTASQTYPSFVPGPPVLWLNNGLGVMTLASLIPGNPAVPGPHTELVDVDLDGDLDAIFAAGNPASGVRIAINTGGGVFSFAGSVILSTTPISGFAIGDFNGDGRPDMAISGVTPSAFVDVVVMNSATGFLAPVSSTLAPQYAVRLATIDINGDGRDELVRSGGTAQSMTMHTVSIGGAVGAPIQTVPGVLLMPASAGNGLTGDLDGDGDGEVFVYYPSASTVLMNDGLGTLVQLPSRTNGQAVNQQQCADVNADGIPDVLGFSTTGPIGINTLLNDGDGFFTPGPFTSTPAINSTFYYSLVAFDRDGDGDADVYAARNVASAFSTGILDIVYDNNGSGGFTQAFTVSGMQDASAMRVADMDGDLDLDLVIGRRGATTIGNGITLPMVLLTNQGGSAAFLPPVSIGSNHATYDVELADFDGNGSIDIFQTNRNVFAGGIGTADFCVLNLNAGNGTFTQVVQSFSGSYSAAGDLNGDGLPDLVVDASVLFNAGNGTFIQGPLLPSPIGVSPVLNDVDGDGDLDLIETPATLMRNIGGGIFLPPESALPRLSIPATSWEIPQSVVTDVDRDGDRDIVAPGPIIASNTTRQIARGSIPRPGRPASLDLYGAPGGAYVLFASSGTSVIPFPPYGTVLLDPSNFVFFTGNYAGLASSAPGVATYGLTTPTNPALIGLSVYWQGFDVPTLRFTNRMRTTILSY